MSKRFSKQLMLAFLEGRIRRLKNLHGFDDGNGWAQVDGKGEELNRAYGRYTGLIEVYEAVRDGVLDHG